MSAPPPPTSNVPAYFCLNCGKHHPSQPKAGLCDGCHAGVVIDLASPTAASVRAALGASFTRRNLWRDVRVLVFGTLLITAPIWVPVGWMSASRALREWRAQAAVAADIGRAAAKWHVGASDKPWRPDFIRCMRERFGLEVIVGTLDEEQRRYNIAMATHLVEAGVGDPASMCTLDATLGRALAVPAEDSAAPTPANTR